jgi:hypothetical protein
MRGRNTENRPPQPPRWELRSKTVLQRQTPVSPAAIGATLHCRQPLLRLSPERLRHLSVASLGSRRERTGRLTPAVAIERRSPPNKTLGSGGSLHPEAFRVLDPDHEALAPPLACRRQTDDANCRTPLANHREIHQAPDRNHAPLRGTGPDLSRTYQELTPPSHARQATNRRTLASGTRFRHSLPAPT